MTSIQITHGRTKYNWNLAFYKVTHGFDMYIALFGHNLAVFVRL